MLLAGVIIRSPLTDTSGALVAVSRMLTATVAVFSGAERTSRSTSSRMPAVAAEAKTQAAIGRTTNARVIGRIVPVMPGTTPGDEEDLYAEYRTITAGICNIDVAWKAWGLR